MCTFVTASFLLHSKIWAQQTNLKSNNATNVSCMFDWAATAMGQPFSLRA